MRPIAVILIFLATSVNAGGTAPDSLSAADSTRVNAAPSMWATPRYNPVDQLLRVNFAARGAGYGGRALFGPAVPVRTEPLTALEKTVLGADKGAYTGLAIGTLGSWLGLWEESTAWQLMGAGAAMGGLLGRISDNAGISIGISGDRERDRR